MEELKASLKLLIITTGLALAPCSYEKADNEPPAVPKGVHSITGDKEVLLVWYKNTEPDLAGYRVYRGLTSSGPYFLIAETDLDYFLDYGLINGKTYFYAVSAYDINGNESGLSPEMVFDTPRPEGYNEKLFDYTEYPGYAGWDFSAYSVVPYDHPYCDFYFGYDDVDSCYCLYIKRTGGLIQDFGYTESLDDISYAPTQGWSSTGIVEAIIGHTYIIWTWDNHFAKVRITGLGPSYVVFDWAYQIDPGNPELVLGNKTEGG